MLVDLRNHIVTKAGTWTDAAQLANQQPPFTLADTYTASKLMLRWENDTVMLAGPLRVRVSFQSENVTFPVNYEENPFVGRDALKANLLPGAVGLQSSTVYSYVLDIPAAQAWPFRFRDDDLMRKLGTNFGYRVIVEPAFDTPVSVGVRGNDLPCDFAVSSDGDTGRFFPASCEPCPPGASIGLPPTGPALGIPVAEGGCVRPRWFNGQFITREDLETEQRYFRLKGRLQNRAMGEGVVWGLGVGKAGNHVCVMPGYAVDCCGNDLTLTSVYRVEIATLLRDPAALVGLSVPIAQPPRALPLPTDPHGSAGTATATAAGTPVRAPVTIPGRNRLNRGAVSALERACFTPAVFDPRTGVRMHLLLEYVECPSEPRPVHADPCAGTANRCEMSRIRETVRLRLVPPRDYTTEGPLKKFLDRVAALRLAHPVIEAIPPSQVTQAPPFQFRLTLVTQQGEQSSTFRVDQVPAEMSTQEPITAIRLALVNEPMWVFAGGTLEAVDGQNQPIPPAPFELASAGFEIEPPSIELAVIPGVGTQMAVQVAQWMSQSFFATPANEAFTGTATLAIAVSSPTSVALIGGATNGEVQRVTIDVLEVCVGEPCQPAGAPPVLPHLPWLHSDPVDPAIAGDPKALVLAGLGAWLTRVLAAHRTGTDEEFSAKRTLATGLYEAAWLLFYGQQQGATPAETQDALCVLFRDWCEAFLYKGPRCAGEPHGVVIGCAVVAGGTIGDIDPYGGRRWVMHGPLIGHWMSQLGMAPIDVTASRFLSQLCCVASLPSIGALDAFPAIVLKLKTGFLTFGLPDDVKAKLLTEHGVTITKSETVGFLELVGRFIGSMDGSTTARTGVRYSLGSPMQDRVLSVVALQA